VKLAAAIVTLLGVFGFLGVNAALDWDYQYTHKPMAQAMWADYEFRKCLQDCRTDQLTMCAAIGVGEDECPVDCSRCDKYLKGDE
jgi:hypothetical protein